MVNQLSVNFNGPFFLIFPLPRLKAELGDLKRTTANRLCFDCGAADVTWASPKLGTFLCARWRCVALDGEEMGKPWENHRKMVV